MPLLRRLSFSARRSSWRCGVWSTTCPARWPVVASVRDGGSASVKLCEAFGTYKNFREFRDNQEARQLFLSTCSPAEVQAAAFIKTAMEGNIVTHDILQNSLKANWLQPAELIMQNPSWVEKEIFDLDELLKQDPLVPVQTEVNQSDTAAALATKPEAKEEDEAESVSNAPLKDEIPEVTTDAAGPVEQTCSRASFFSVATIPAWAEDLFQKVTLATFQQSLEHARACRVLIVQIQNMSGDVFCCRGCFACRFLGT